MAAQQLELVAGEELSQLYVLAVAAQTVAAAQAVVVNHLVANAAVHLGVVGQL